jgi:hypothetical protein
MLSATLPSKSALADWASGNHRQIHFAATYVSFAIDDWRGLVLGERIRAPAV